MSDKEYWDSIYQSKGDERLSWTQAEPLLSMKLVNEVCSSGRVIDVGGGRSFLVERLLDRGYSVTVLDISESALERERKRLAARASQIDWIVADITTVPSLDIFDVWLDRAVFHFLIAPTERAAYRRSLLQAIPVGAHAVIGTFAIDGPESCSGLQIRRYDGPMIAKELGAQLTLVRSELDIHLTPWGQPQSFQFSLFRRV